MAECGVAVGIWNWLGGPEFAGYARQADKLLSVWRAELTAFRRTWERGILGMVWLTRSCLSAAASARPDSIVVMAHKCLNGR